ncbi:hypothetical protein ACUXHY_003162 [Cytobacillus horneckiae]
MIIDGYIEGVEVSLDWHVVDKVFNIEKLKKCSA